MCSSDLPIVEQCKNNLHHIIQKARQQGSTVVISTIFPLGEIPLERRLIWSDEVAASINEVNEFIVAQQATDVIIFPGYQLLSDQKDKVKPEYSRDLLHLNAAGYKRLNQQLSKLLETL